VLFIRDVLKTKAKGNLVLTWGPFFFFFWHKIVTFENFFFRDFCDVARLLLVFFLFDSIFSFCNKVVQCER